MDKDIESVEDISLRRIRTLKRVCAMTKTKLLEQQLSTLWDAVLNLALPASEQLAQHVASQMGNVRCDPTDTLKDENKAPLTSLRAVWHLSH